MTANADGTKKPARRPVELHSPMTPEAIAERLKTIMDDPKPKAKSRVYGKGSQYDMELRYLRRDKQTGLEPVLIAEMEEHDGGTRIIGDYGLPVSPKLLTCGCFAFLGFFVLTGLLLMLEDPLFGAIFAAVPLAIGYAGWRGLKKQDEAVDDDWKKIAAFLRKEIAAIAVP